MTLQHGARLSAKHGAKVELQGSAKDPDGNQLDYRWWQYGEADSYAGKIIIDKANNKNASFMIPSDAHRGDEIHIILEVTDKGSPRLTRYQRVIVKVAE